MSRERWGRTLQWDAKLEAAVAALTLEQVNAAFKRHVNPAAISFVKGGDFKKGARTGSSFRWIEFRSCELYPAAS